MTSPRNVLVIGDAMIDRAWVVVAGAETSQAHGDVAPQKVIDPALAGTRPGGAALTAAFLATDRNIKAWLLAPYGNELRQLLIQAEVQTFEALADAARQDTIKFRIYADRGDKKRPELSHRFDLDIGADNLRIPPHIPPPDCILVADFLKGVATEAHLQTLATSYSEAQWFIDSKNPTIVSYKMWARLGDRNRPTLFVNREEFAALLDAWFRGPNERARKFSGEWHHVESLVLEDAKRFHAKFKNWDLVVKLDIDGAAAFWSDGRDWKFALAQPPRVKAATGIGAGDAFLAGWTNCAINEKAREVRLQQATERAWAWVTTSEAKAKASGSSRDLAPSPQPEWPTCPELERPQAQLVNKRIRARQDEDSLNGMLRRREISLSEASGYCGDFLTMDAAVGAKVRAFASEIRTYFRSQSVRRPLNCLVWAVPGSGKSFLVEEVAKEVGVKFKEINVATVTSLADLKERLESLRSEDDTNQLVMIDEFMAKVGAEHVLPALLAPLWSKVKSKKLAFVLVDSYSDHGVGSAEAFCKFLAGGSPAVNMPAKTPKKDVVKAPDKGPDLVSRINGPQLSLMAPKKPDRAVMVASLLRRLHKKSAFAIEPDALQALVDDPTSGTWSPRAIEYVVEALSPTANVACLKDLKKISELCTRMGIDLNRQVGGRPIKISDKPPSTDQAD